MDSWICETLGCNTSHRSQLGVHSILGILHPYSQRSVRVWIHVIGSSNTPDGLFRSPWYLRPKKWVDDPRAGNAAIIGGQRNEVLQHRFVDLYTSNKSGGLHHSLKMFLRVGWTRSASILDVCREVAEDVKWRLQHRHTTKADCLFWSGRCETLQSRMIRASTEESLRKALNGISTKIQATDEYDLEHRQVLETVAKAKDTWGASGAFSASQIFKQRDGI